MEAKGDFTKLCWKSIELLFKQLIGHPFVVGLADGTLSHSSFAHYLKQDILYIREDSKALFKLAERLELVDEKGFFEKLGRDGVEIELLLQNDYLKFFNLEEEKKMSPVIKTYSDFLLFHANNSSTSVSAAALLPCFWVYHEVGKHIKNKSVPKNIYQKWIDTYQGDEYAEYVDDFVQLVEKMAANATSEIRNQMLNVFVESTQFELDFFDESMSK